MSLLSLIFDEYYSSPWTSRRWPSMLETRDKFPFRISDSFRELNQHRNQLVELEKDTSITIDEDQFQANIDVQQFKPEEISVKLADNTVTIEGKHEERQDEHGFISRHFVRKYVLPEDCDIKQLQSKLSSDGVLRIKAPKKPQKMQVNYRDIPIIRTGQPIKNSEPKNDGDAPKKS